MSEDSLMERDATTEEIQAGQQRQQILVGMQGWIHQGLEPGPGLDSGSHCSLALVEGEAGVGKSWLIEEALKARDTTESESILCCRVQCHDRQGIPFLPVLRLIKDLILQSGEDSALWKRYAHVLARVFPELRRELGEESRQSSITGSKRQDPVS